MPKPPSIWPVILVLGVLLLVAGLGSLGELEYLLRGRRALAVVDSSVRINTNPGMKSGRIVQEVQYHFLADGAERQGRERLATYWLAPKAGDKVPVQYLPGRVGKERLVSSDPKVMPDVFVFCIGALVVVCAVLAFEKHRRGRHRRKREMDEE